MKKLLVLTCVIFALPIFALGQTPENELGQLLTDQIYEDNYEFEAFIILDTIFIDINEINGGNLLTLGNDYLYTVNFTNPTNKDVKLKGFSNPCACIATDWSSSVVSSGGTGFIKIKYKSTIVGPTQKLYTAIFYDKNGIKPVAKLPIVIRANTSNPITPQTGN